MFSSQPSSTIFNSDLLTRLFTFIRPLIQGQRASAQGSALRTNCRWRPMCRCRITRLNCAKIHSYNCTMSTCCYCLTSTPSIVVEPWATRTWLLTRASAGIRRASASALQKCRAKSCIADGSDTASADWKFSLYIRLGTRPYHAFMACCTISIFLVVRAPRG